MAIQLNATKGGFAVTAGYLIVTMVQMTRYLKPVMVKEKVTQADGSLLDVERPTTIPAVEYRARGQIYPSMDARVQNFGATDLNFAFSFAHADGRDPTAEAYEYVKANGLQGWTLSSMVDA